MAKKIVCKICGEELKKNELKEHQKLHMELEPDPMPKSIFGVR